MNIDEQAIHDLLTRQIDLMRFERSVARDALRQLERMQEEVEANLRRRELSALNRRDLERLLSEIDEVLAHYYGLIDGMVQEAQTEVVADEHEWLLWWLGGLSAAYVLDGAVKPLPDARLADFSAHALVGGLTLSEAVTAQRRGLFDVLKRMVRLAAADGASFDDVADVFKRQAAQLRTLTRTWAGSIQGTVHYAFGSINPLVKGWRHVAVLDGHTSGMCTARHGLVWDKKKQPVGHAYPFRRPPLHPNCRSRLAFVFDLDAPFHGITGEDWVKGRTLPQLQEQFGHGIGQMLHEGKISLADAVRSDGLAAVTLADLRRKYDPLYIVPFVDTAILQGAGFSQSQMRKKFKHASVFGIDARKSNPKNWKAFQEAVVSHLNDEQTVLKGRYRLEGSKVFYNGQTDIAVVFDKDNRFVTAMKISGKQREHYLNTDYLQ